jgi:PTH2 family peptidyl-tRNA hydrolase
VFAAIDPAASKVAAGESNTGPAPAQPALASLQKASEAQAQERPESNDPIVAMLTEMGFAMDRATHAVALTGGMDVQLAMNWLLEHADEPLPSSSLVPSRADEPEIATQQYEQVKMVIAVRRDLSMGKGKIAAQCAHAAVDLYRQLSRQEQLHSSLQALLLNQWEANGEPKIVVG